MWRVVGVGVGLPRHDEEVVLEDDAVAMLKRMSQKDDTIAVFHVCFRAGCCDIRNLSASLARP